MLSETLLPSTAPSTGTHTSDKCSSRDSRIAAQNELSKNGHQDKLLRGSCHALIGACGALAFHQCLACSARPELRGCLAAAQLHRWGNQHHALSLLAFGNPSSSDGGRLKHLLKEISAVYSHSCEHTLLLADRLYSMSRTCTSKTF